MLILRSFTACSFGKTVLTPVRRRRDLYPNTPEELMAGRTTKMPKQDVPRAGKIYESGSWRKRVRGKKRRKESILKRREGGDTSSKYRKGDPRMELDSSPKLCKQVCVGSSDGSDRNCQVCVRAPRRSLHPTLSLPPTVFAGHGAASVRACFLCSSRGHAGLGIRLRSGMKTYCFQRVRPSLAFSKARCAD